MIYGAKIVRPEGLYREVVEGEIYTDDRVLVYTDNRTIDLSEFLSKYDGKKVRITIDKI